ncbi:hypothetical protein K435DRAFT_792159 [Dendrothele bispora CBS 962.96]|uniref:Uncharacterized protein n=1 Tax=Dendrothele bispora (strain CBS 962.96) TaxID=1314807 RepID=A0A4S8MJK2_DENBC|nr:hypothetical protein K435DRAFT_792159 [Dendrothele bispora CBS 962.96]
MIIDLPETASLYASGYFPGPPGYHPLHQRPSHHGFHVFPPHLPGLYPIPPFPSTAGQGAASFPFPPTHEELPLHMRFSNLHHEQTHGHTRGPGGRGFPMPPPLPHGYPPPIAPFGFHAFGHGRGIPMPPPGPPPFEFPPPPELGAYGHPTPFHTHVPGPPPARSDRGRFGSFRAHVRFAATVPPTEATATATADTSDTTTAETAATAASIAPPQAARGDDTVPDPASPHPRHHHHHHLRGPRYFSGPHTHHGRGGFHRHHRRYDRFGPHTHISVHGGSCIPLLINMRRALRFSQRHGHGGYGRGLEFGQGRSFGYPYTGYPSPYYPFGWFGSDDTEGGFDPTSDGEREGEEKEGQEDTTKAGTEAEDNQKDDQGRDEDTQSATLDLGCLSPTLSEPSSESSWSTVSDKEVLEAPGNGNEGNKGIRARARNNDNYPAAEEEDYILLPPRSPSPSELDETSSIDSESNESNPDTTFVPRGRPRSHAHSRHHHRHHPHGFHHRPHSHHHHYHDSPHHRPRLGPWHHFDWARAREAGLGGSSLGLGRGRGFRRGGHIHSHNHLHPRPYFHDHPPHPTHPSPPYHNGPDFDNDTHPDFDQLLRVGTPPHGPFPPPSFPPTVDTNGEESLDFSPGFGFGFNGGHGGRGRGRLGVRGGRGGFRAGGRGRGGRGGGGARGLGLGRQVRRSASGRVFEEMSCKYNFLNKSDSRLSEVLQLSSGVAKHYNGVSSMNPETSQGPGTSHFTSGTPPKVHEPGDIPRPWDILVKTWDIPFQGFYPLGSPMDCTLGHPSLVHFATFVLKIVYVFETWDIPRLIMGLGTSQG